MRTTEFASKLPGLGPVGIALLAVLIGILAFAGMAVLVGTALVGIAAGAVLMSADPLQPHASSVSAITFLYDLRQRARGRRRKGLVCTR